MRTSPWIHATLPLTCALALVLAFVGRQAPAAAQADSETRTLYVSALDRHGVPVEGLGPDAFLVSENGVRREVLRVSPAVEPIDLTVMVDNSSSARDHITFVRPALAAFMAALTPEHRVALIGLADRPTILVPSTTDTKRLTERVSGLFALPQSGMTLLDAMVEVSDGLRKRDPARAAIVALFTDGAEFTNRYSRDVVAALVAARTPVHLVTIGRFVNDTDHADRERAFFIADAPRATGGQIRTMLTANPVGEHLQQVAQELTSQYAVVYARPRSLIPPDKISVMSGREDLTVRGAPARTEKGV
jgi:VWFA-related protein